MSPDSARSAVLCVVSGPSGSGKTTLCRAVSAAEGCHYAISATTRAPRPGEVDGRDYHFLSEDDFQRRVERGDFLEWAGVYGRNYGTLKSEVLDHLDRGTDVLMDLDTQGAAAIRGLDDPRIRLAHFDVFVLPRTFEELRLRLVGRHSDSPETQQRRLANALSEIDHGREYAYTLVSGSKDEDFERLRAILTAERLRSTRCRRMAEFLEGGLPSLETRTNGA
jgi:guanylate kinase